LKQHSLTQLYKTFDKVIYAPLLRSGTVENDTENLQLLGRPELDITFTKLHVFNPDLFTGTGHQPSYDRIVFLDADSFVVRNVDELFGYLEEPDAVFGAAPDVGWPDMFNSGVFVARPRKDVYDGLLKQATEKGSFDGVYYVYYYFVAITSSLRKREVIRIES
jgi:alpha-N-acetylglucosamine transferase